VNIQLLIRIGREISGVRERSVNASRRMRRAITVSWDSHILHTWHSVTAENGSIVKTPKRSVGIKKTIKQKWW
jgi:hypothetical protein